MIGLSTSRNSKNILYAMDVARALGMISIGFSGQNGGKMGEFCDIAFKVPANSIPQIQELHLSVHHALCAAVGTVSFDN